VSRCYLARRRVDRLRTLKETAERRTAAAASVQRLARGFLARRRVARALRLRAVEVEVEAQHGAAVVMQAVARGWLARRVRNAAAVRIQAAARGWLARRLLACMRWMMLMRATQRRTSAAVLLQAAARGCMARRRVAALVALRQHAVVVIQVRSSSPSPRSRPSSLVAAPHTK
jgi:hypothetical protein